VSTVVHFIIFVGKKYWKLYTVLSLFSLRAFLLTVFVLGVLMSSYVYLFILFVFVLPYVYLLYYVFIAVLILDAGLLARSQYPEGPATGHLDTDFFLVSMCLQANAEMVHKFPSCSYMLLM